jgi:hypothetical protein
LPFQEDQPPAGNAEGHSRDAAPVIALSYVLGWRLSREEWDRVAEIIEELGPLGQPVDRRLAQRIQRDLDSVLKAERVGSKNDALPAPRNVRERVSGPIWPLLPPAGEAVREGLAPEDQVGPPDGLAALTRWFSRLATFTLPLFDRGGIAFADTLRVSPAEQVAEHEAGEMRVVVRALGRRTMSVTVGLLASPGELIAIAASGGAAEPPALFLVPVWLDDHGIAVASVEFPAPGPRVTITLTAPLLDTALAAEDAALIVASTRASTPAGRRAWLEIARARPKGDPVSAAVAEGLR